MKEHTEEEMQNITHGIMPQLINDGFIPEPPKDQFKDFSLWLPQGKIKDQMFDDLIALGVCASKTEIVDGRLHIRYVDPISDELRIAIYNAEHKDSQIRKYPLTPDECLPMPKSSEDQKPTNNS